MGGRVGPVAVAGAGGDFWSCCSFTPDTRVGGCRRRLARFKFKSRRRRSRPAI